MGDIKNVVSVIYSVMQEYASTNSCGSSVLEYLENKEGKQGLFKHLTEYRRTSVNNLKKMEQNLAKDMLQFSKKLPPLQDGLQVEVFLPDYDIKDLLEYHLGCNIWRNANTGIHTACYEDRYKRDMLSEWSLIEQEELRK